MLQSDKVSEKETAHESESSSVPQVSVCSGAMFVPISQRIGELAPGSPPSRCTVPSARADPSSGDGDDRRARTEAVKNLSGAKYE